MYVSELNLSTRVINTLLRAGINTVEKLHSLINKNKLYDVRALDKNGISEIMKEVYCRDCKRSIYGEYKDCDINTENSGKYVKGVCACRCKVTNKENEQA